MEEWDRNLFDKELRKILTSKLPVSASRIDTLKKLAIDHPQDHNYISQNIVRFIETSPPEYRLAGIYVIDAISRSIQKKNKAGEQMNNANDLNGYFNRFASLLREPTLTGCFQKCTTKDKDKAKRTLLIWEKNGTYSKDVVDDLRNSFFGNDDDHNNEEDSGSTTPPYPPPDVSNSSITSPPPVIDTASILASLSSLNNGNNVAAPLNLGNLIPSSTPININTATTTAITTATVTNGNEQNVAPVPIETNLPDSVLSMLSGFVTSKTEEPNSDNNNNNNVSSTSSLTPIQQQTNNNNISNKNVIINNNNINNNNNNGMNLSPTITSFNGNYPSLPNALVPSNQSSMNPPLPLQSSSSPPIQNPSIPLPPPYLLPNAQYPMKDVSIPSGSIRVLTRTLFVGPLPLNYEREDVEKLFANYGKIIYVNVQKKVGCSAFIKLPSHHETRLLKYKTGILNVKGLQTKINWAFGFGPRKNFNHEAGESIIPLNELNSDEHNILSRSSIGGFHGLPVTEKMTIEEPSTSLIGGGNKTLILDRRKEESSRSIDGLSYNNHSNQNYNHYNSYNNKGHHQHLKYTNTNNNSNNNNNHNNNSNHHHSTYNNNNHSNNNNHYNNKRSIPYSNKKLNDDYNYKSQYHRQQSPPSQQQNYRHDDYKRKKSRFD